MLAYSSFGFRMKQRWAEFVGYIGILTPLLEDAVQLYVVVAEWTTMALVNLGFTVVNILYTVINKVIQKLSEGGVDEEVVVEEQNANPLSDDARRWRRRTRLCGAKTRRSRPSSRS